MSKDWLAIAGQIYKDSTDYLDSSIRPKWDIALSLVQNQHPTGSRFNNEAYAHRSKIFRPKLKPAVRRHVSSLASALFTNDDAMFVQPEDVNDKAAAAAARMCQSLLQRRLDNDLNWFLTSLAAYQDTLIYSICVSKQFWSFDGDALDKPVLELIKPENFRFDPNADWRSPAKTSPYLIEIIPMYAGDVLTNIQKNENWFNYSLEEILSAPNDANFDTTRLSREGNERNDPNEVTTGNEYSTVYVHFNVYREAGEDVAFYTLGTDRLLSNPVPLADLYAHGRALYQVGFSTIESHKNYPMSLVDDGAPLQEEQNRLVNNRLDNVNQVLNKRFFIRRQGNVDLRSLMRNVPGGGIMVDDPHKDVLWMDTPDVTSAAYQEQDRLNAETDDVLATTNSGTVQSNRMLNETVGGMNLMAAGANTDGELMMKTFIFSWVEPVLGTLLKLCQLYETDTDTLNKSAAKAGLLGFEEAPPEKQDELILSKMKLTVNVGMGNTNPEQKVKKLMLAVNATAQMPGIAERTDWAEVAKELYSYAGYGDAGRFIKSDEEMDPAQEPPPDPKAQIEQAKLELQKQQHEAQIQLEQLKMQNEMQMLQAKHAQEMQLLKIKSENDTLLTQTQLDASMQLEAAKLQTDRDKVALQERNKMNELKFKAQTGQPGI